MDLDVILQEIGEYGPYQKLIVAFILLPAVFPCGFHAYDQLFMTSNPDHWCKVAPHLDELDPAFAKNLSIPLEEREGKFTYSQCYMYELNGTNSNWNSSKVACKYGWTYNNSLQQNTITTEWNLVCEKSFYATLALVLFAISGLIGNYIFGYIQDGVGRKPAFFIYLCIQCVFGVATAFANNFTMWTIFRCGVGFTIPAILATPIVLAIELVGPHYRTFVTILSNIAYSVALTALGGVVWLVRDWRKLSLMTTLPFLSLFFLYWFLPESPRWLLAQGKIREAERILYKIAKYNRKRLTKAHIHYLRAESQRTNESYGIQHLFRTPNLRKKTIIITFIWFTNTSVYVGLSYYAPSLGGNEYHNFLMAALAELPTYVFLLPAMEKCGRRWTLCVSMIVGGAACVITFLFRKVPHVTLALYCVGKMGISCSFVVLPLMAAELYPTVVRGLGISFSSVVGMLGPVFIPLVNYLGTEILTLPLLIMGVLLIAGGTSSLLLPETVNQHLPQTLEDGEREGIKRFNRDILKA